MKAAAAALEVIRLIPIKDLVVSKWNQRSIESHTKRDIEDMARSILQNGILHPIILRPNGGKGKFEVVAGQLRWLGSDVAKRPNIPAIVREKMTDQEALDVSMIENLHQSNLHPLDEAYSYKRRMELDAKCTVEILAAKLGKDKREINKRLALLNLTPALRTHFRKDQINAAVAFEFARYMDRDQKACLEELQDAVGFDLTVSEVRQWFEANVLLDLSKAQWDMDDSDLVKEAGSCTKCPKRTGFKPDLFPEIKKKDTCTDRVCFGEKRAAFVELIVAKNPGTRKIAMDQHGATDKLPADVLTSYHRSKKGECSSTEKAIVVACQMYSSHQVGSAAYICADLKCSTHNMSIQGMQQSAAPTDRSKVLDESAAARNELAKRRAIWQATVDQFSWSEVGLADIMFMNFEVAHSLENYARRHVNEALGEDGDILKLILKGDGRDEQMKLLFIMTLAQWRDGKPYRNEAKPIDSLLVQAKRWNIDVDAIVKPIDDAFQARMAKRLDNRKKKHAADERAEAAGKLKKGVCQECGCTETTPCAIPIGSDGGSIPCSWTDASQTLCTNPACDDANRKRNTDAVKRVKSASKTAKPAKKSAKKK